MSDVSLREVKVHACPAAVAVSAAGQREQHQLCRYRTRDTHNTLEQSRSETNPNPNSEQFHRPKKAVLPAGKKPPKYLLIQLLFIDHFIILNCRVIQHHQNEHLVDCVHIGSDEMAANR